MISISIKSIMLSSIPITHPLNALENVHPFISMNCSSLQTPFLHEIISPYCLLFWYTNRTMPEHILTLNSFPPVSFGSPYASFQFRYPVSIVSSVWTHVPLLAESVIPNQNELEIPAFVAAVRASTFSAVDGIIARVVL